MKTKNILSVALFLICATFFIAASSISKSNASLISGDCHNCGTASACEIGGQSSGWTNCEYNPDVDPPDNCVVYGAGCGGFNPYPEVED